jgi:hypothetical protein
VASEVERLCKEIMGLPPTDRAKLRLLLERSEGKRVKEVRFHRAAGSWSDIDAEKLIAETYANRSASRSQEALW